MIRHSGCYPGSMGALVPAALLLGCAGPASESWAPQFGPPRQQVFHEPASILSTTHDELLPTLGPSGAVIAYAAKPAGNLDVFVRPLTGGSAVRLTTHSTDDRDPALSPDGQSIAWVSQSQDVKGDIWVMDHDGGGKRRLTGRESEESGPVWGPTGEFLYFTTRVPGAASQSIDRLHIAAGTRDTLVARGWDPAISPDGKVLFYAALDDQKRSRLFAKEMDSGKVAALTDGAYLEVLPRTFASPNGPSGSCQVLFGRFVDDGTGDGKVDVDDPPSIWSVRFEPALFDGDVPAVARPLTAGDGGEIFASSSAGWMVYTAAGIVDLDLHALPAEGVINANATPEAVLEAARAEDNPAYRRLALRYLVSTTPSMVGPARYELARDLAERGKLPEAIDEMQRAASAAQGSPLAGVARIEIQRLRMLQALRGSWMTRRAEERELVVAALGAIEGIAVDHPGSLRVRTRAQSARAEGQYALGHRHQAVSAFERIAKQENVPGEDGARALDHLADIYADMDDLDSVARVSRRVLDAFASERFYVRRTAQRWVDAARSTKSQSVMAALEDIARQNAELPVVAARALAGLAEVQGDSGHDEMAMVQWQRIVDNYGSEREVLAKALLTLGDTAAARGQRDQALDAYERLLAEFPERRDLRSRARNGITRIALSKARLEERAGDTEKARESYRRLLRTDQKMIVAQRRYIALSMQLGASKEVLAWSSQRAHNGPRDKFARYGYGYALSFLRPLPLEAAEEEIAAALELDPRFAVAHLTRGWLRLQREQREPGQGWLEAAEKSFETARQLSDPRSDAEIWSAAQLNKGNALFALGKSDLAFPAYLARELSSVRFDPPLTEVLFRESFARVALREEHYDVALDMARLAQRLSVRLPTQPRRASVTSLLAALYLLTERFGDALEWYGRAVELYTKQERWDRVVPNLRGKALAHLWLGQAKEAEEIFREVIRVLGHGDGPHEDISPSAFRPEIPADNNNVTRAVYGFSSRQEEEIARSISARILRKRGLADAARQYYHDRLSLLRLGAESKRLGSRIHKEFLYALHESAIVEAQDDRAEAAMAHWREALAIVRKSERWADAVVILEAMAHVWVRRPQARGGPLAQEALLTAHRGLAALLALDRPDLARRLARWISLESLTTAIGPAPGPPGADEGEDPRDIPVQDRLRRSLIDLDEAVEAAATAVDLSYLAMEPTIRAHAAEFLGSSVGAPAGSPDSPGLTWRRAFDRALLAEDQQAPGHEPGAWMAAAIQAFANEPAPEWASERDLFLAMATEHLLASGDVESTWRFLERARLLELQPPLTRVSREPLTSAWKKLRDARPDPKTHAEGCDKASTLVRALEGCVAPLGRVRGFLGQNAVLVQVFAPDPRTWHWFVLTKDLLVHAQTGPMADHRLPADVAKLLADSGVGDDQAVLYMDAGELLTRPAWQLLHQGTALGMQFDVVEVLSATYLLAAYEQRNLSREGVFVVGAGEQEQRTPAADDTEEVLGVAATLSSVDSLRARGGNRRLLHLQLDAATHRVAHRPAGHSHVFFHAPLSLRWRVGLTLDEIASVELDSNLGLADNTGDDPRTPRAISQALLLAGVPTAVIGQGNGPPGAARQRLLEATRTRSVGAAFRELAGAGDVVGSLRVLGYGGMSPTQQVEFAGSKLLRVAKAGAAAFNAANKLRLKRGKAPSHLAKKAIANFSDWLDLVKFLLVPRNDEIMKASKMSLLRKLPRLLPNYQVLAQENLAKSYRMHGELEEAAALFAMVVDAHQAKGRKKRAVVATSSLGDALAQLDRHTEAAAAFRDCIDIAHGLGEAVIEATCQLNLGKQLEHFSNWTGAARAYEAASALAASRDSHEQVFPQLYLGVIYENRFNDYDRALEYFQKALETARRHPKRLEHRIPSTHLSIARVLRQRGNYKAALEKVSHAEQLLGDAPPNEQAEAALERAKIYWYSGNYRRAFDRQKKGLRLAREAGSSFLEIQALSLGGLISLNQGELVRAERFVREALDLSRVTKRQREEAMQLQNLGNVLREAGRLDEAVAQYRSALAIDNELGSAEGRAFDLRNLGMALNLQHNYQEALPVLDEALELSRSIGSRFNEIQCLYARGEALAALGDPAAMEQLETAARLAGDASLPESEWRALYAQGRLHEKLTEVPQARADFDEALAVAERLGRGRSAGSSMHSRDALYGDAVRLAVASNDVPAVYQYAERSRARALLDVLGTQTIKLPSEGQKLLSSELRAREAKVVAQREANGGGSEALAALRKAEETHRRARAALRAKYSRIARVFSISPEPVDQLQARLPENSVVVSYFVGPTATVAMLLRRDGLDVRTLEVRRETLVALVGRIRRAMAAFGPVDGDLAQAAELLIEPFADALTDVDLVVFIPQGPLYHVPFAALPLQGAPLLERFAIAESPSGSLLYDQLREQSAPPPRRVVAFAPASDLPFARLEALAIAGDSALLGPLASESRLRASRSDALDLAAHGVLDAEDPLSSALMMARDDGDDGRLEVREVFSLSSLPPLVTLSACDSVGGDMHGDEWLGLTNAFLAGGARTVVASLNRVSDLAASIVIKRFYRELQTQSRAQALRQAALLARRYFEHPAHWSSFVLFGDFR